MIHPASLLSESEGQIRRGWADFLSVWGTIEAGWRDDNRQQWEKQIVQAAPNTLSYTTTSIAELREAAVQCLAELSDPANPEVTL
jgi:hypothetical protein